MDPASRWLEEEYGAKIEAVRREIRSEEPTWSPDAIRRIIQDCIDNEERQCEEWFRYAESRNLTVAMNADGAWIRMIDYRDMEQQKNEYRVYARWLAFMLAVSAISFAVLWGSR